MPSRAVDNRDHQPLRVLVVDDDSITSELFWRNLPADRFNVTTASNGLEAIARLKDEPFDVLVTDIVMPGLDGLSLIAHVRSTPRLRHLPVLVATGYMADPTRSACLEAGADELITKPFRTSLLPPLLDSLVLGRQK